MDLERLPSSHVPGPSALRFALHCPQVQPCISVKSLLCCSRCVQNADILMTDVFVPDGARLPGVDSFQDTNKVLAISRIMVAWQPVGIAMGAYDMAVR